MCNVYLLAKFQTDWTFLNLNHILIFRFSHAKQNIPTKKKWKTQGEKGIVTSNILGVVYVEMIIPCIMLGMPGYIPKNTSSKVVITVQNPNMLLNTFSGTS